MNFFAGSIEDTLALTGKGVYGYDFLYFLYEDYYRDSPWDAQFKNYRNIVIFCEMQFWFYCFTWFTDI